MGRKKCLGIIIVSWIAVSMVCSLSYGQVKPGPKVPPQPGISTAPSAPSPAIPIPDDPAIREFIGPAYPMVQGAELTLRWRVEPGPGGSPIAQVNITGPYLPEQRLSPAGERKVIFTGSNFTGSRIYTLTATNSRGRSATQTLTIRHLSIQDALDRLGISLRSVPPEFKAGQPIDLEGLFSQTEGPPLVGMNVVVTQGGREAARLSGIAIGHGTASTPFRLRDSGFTATAGEYVVDVEYRGEHRSKRFRTVAVPYYSIAATP